MKTKRREMEPPRPNSQQDSCPDRQLYLGTRTRRHTLVSHTLCSRQTCSQCRGKHPNSKRAEKRVADAQRLHADHPSPMKRLFERTTWMIETVTRGRRCRHAGEARGRGQHRFFPRASRVFKQLTLARPWACFQSRQKDGKLPSYFLGSPVPTKCKPRHARPRQRQTSPWRTGTDRSAAPSTRDPQLGLRGLGCSGGRDEERQLPPPPPGSQTLWWVRRWGSSVGGPWHPGRRDRR